MQNNDPKLSTICTLTGVFVLGAGGNLTVLMSESSPFRLFQAARPAVAIPLVALLALFGIGLIMVPEAITAVRSK